MKIHLWEQNRNKTIIYLSKKPQKIYIISIAIISTLKIKNATHLAIGIKFTA